LPMTARTARRHGYYGVLVGLIYVNMRTSMGAMALSRYFLCRRYKSTSTFSP